MEGEYVVEVVLTLIDTCTALLYKPAFMARWQ